MFSRFFFRASRIVLAAYAGLMFRMDIRRHSPLPRGAVLFAANHPCITDPVLIHLLEKGCRRIPTTLEGEPDPVSWYLHGPYAITIGKAVRFEGDVNGQNLVRSISETVMQRIRPLALESKQRMRVFWA
jgi:hypothetical protein